MNTSFTVTYICLVVYLWDWASSLSIECDFLWSRPLKEMRTAQVLYVLTRYSALFCHGTNLAIVHFREEYSSPMSLHTCRRMLFFNIVTVAWAFGLLLANLMLRVYALYMLDFRILLTLGFLLGLKIVNVLVCWFVFIPRLTFNAFCGPTNARPTRIALSMAFELVVQAIPVSLTLIRGAKIEQGTRARRIIVLLRYMRRGGVLSWTAVTVYWVSFLSVAFCTGDITDTLLNISYPIFMTFIPFLGCRILLHFSQPDGESAPEPSSSVPTSFELDMLYTAWDTQSTSHDLGS